MVSLTFQATTDIKLSEVLTINSRYTKAEAYNNDYEVMDVNILVEGTNGVTTQTELYQNRPNPFSNETTFGFYLDGPDLVKLTFDTGLKYVYYFDDVKSGEYWYFARQPIDKEKLDEYRLKNKNKLRNNSL